MKKNSLAIAIVVVACIAISGVLVYAQNSDSPFKGGSESTYIPPKVGSYIVPIKAGLVTLDQESLVKQLNLSFPKNKASEIYNIIKNTGSDQAKMIAALTAFDKNIKIAEITAAINAASALTTTKQNRIITIQNAQLEQIKRQEELARIAAAKTAAEQRLSSEKAILAQIALQQQAKITQVNQADVAFKQTLSTGEIIEYENFKKEMTNPAKAQAYKDWYAQQTSSSSDHSSSSSDHSSTTTTSSTIVSIIRAVTTPIINFFKSIFSW